MCPGRPVARIDQVRRRGVLIEFVTARLLPAHRRPFRSGLRRRLLDTAILLRRRRKEGSRRRPQLASPPPRADGAPCRAGRIWRLSPGSLRSFARACRTSLVSAPPAQTAELRDEANHKAKHAADRGRHNGEDNGCKNRTKIPRAGRSGAVGNDRDEGNAQRKQARHQRRKNSSENCGQERKLTAHLCLNRACKVFCVRP